MGAIIDLGSDASPMSSDLYIITAYGVVATFAGGFRFRR
jgi:hypothetical protein